jgi:hypothetical protein
MSAPGDLRPDAYDLAIYLPELPVTEAIDSVSGNATGDEDQDRQDKG